MAASVDSLQSELAVGQCGGETEGPQVAAGVTIDEINVAGGGP